MSETPSEAPPPSYSVAGQFPPPPAGPPPHNLPSYADLDSGERHEHDSPSHFVPYRPPLSAEEEKQQLQLQQEEQDRQQQQHQEQQRQQFPPPGPPPPQYHDQQNPTYQEFSPLPPHPPKEPEQQQQQQHDLPFRPQQEFPPPPPHPTEKQNDQHQQQNLPPGDFPPPPGQPPAQAPLNEEQYFPPPPGQQQPSPAPPKEEQYFPPPPPLPHPESPSEKHGQHEVESQQPAYSIPAYDPANPVFAPPPTRPQADHHLQTGQGEHAHQQQQHEQQHPQEYQPHGQPQPSSSSAHGHHGQPTSQDRPKQSWSERFSHFSVKAAAPINSIAHKFGSQSFLPETLDKECDKAAAILKAFCSVYAEPGPSDDPSNANAPPPGPIAADKKNDASHPARAKPKDRVIVTIPPKVISKAVGLAIFTTLRAGYGLSGATGSGVLVARLPDGSWSPPSGIQLHSVGGGFQIGLDIYDCVCVINNQKALEAFMDRRVSLGSDLAVVAGPYGAGAAVDFGAAMPDASAKTAKNAAVPPKAGAAVEAEPPQQEGQKQQQEQKEHQEQPPSVNGPVDKKKDSRRGVPPSATKPVFSYVKSRGFYAGISVDGTVVAERKDANAAFYGQAVSVQQILRGQVPSQGPSGMWPSGAQNLLAILRGAEAGATQQQQQVPGQSSHERYQDEQGAPPPAYVDDGLHPVDPDVKYK
ncbi:SH3 domain-containing protein [Escovopsis weberi]|uniref:SH3 domain-containing protein n=1 Tax=Escovopsis weberi TaxID=150374 RepID=A0A0N0RU83_ESCWE|nr:SH3 domain-containing protein [Escovopsis weberi]